MLITADANVMLRLVASIAAIAATTAAASAATAIADAIYGDA